MKGEILYKLQPVYIKAMVDRAKEVMEVSETAVDLDLVGS